LIDENPTSKAGEGGRLDQDAAAVVRGDVDAGSADLRREVDVMKKIQEDLAEIERLVNSLRRGWSIPPGEADWLLRKLSMIRVHLDSLPGKDSIESGDGLVEQAIPPGQEKED
jgi:hypothetical protein